MADIGTGAVLAVGSLFTADLLSIEVSGIARESIETSHLGTTTARTYIQGDLYDPGTVEVEYLLDSSNPLGETPPILTTNTAATLTVTFPLEGTHTTAATFTASAFQTESGFSVPLEDRMTATATFKLSGAAAFTDAS
jgi:hypothetical protein